MFFSLFYGFVYSGWSWSCWKDIGSEYLRPVVFVWGLSGLLQRDRDFSFPGSSFILCALVYHWLWWLKSWSEHSGLSLLVAIPAGLVIWGISGLWVQVWSLGCCGGLARAGCSLVQGDSVCNCLCLCIEWGFDLPWHCGTWTCIWDLCFSAGLGLCLSISFVSVNLHGAIPFLCILLFVYHSDWGQTVNLFEYQLSFPWSLSAFHLFFLLWFSHILRGSLWGCDLSGLCDCRGLP